MPLPIQRLAALAARIGFGLVSGEGGATEDVVFHLGKAHGAYDPVTDAITPSAGTDVPAAVIAFKRKETQTGVGLQIDPRQFSSATATLMVEAASLPAGAIIAENDTVTRSDAAEWNIVDVQLDPGRAAWLVDVRK